MCSLSLYLFALSISLLVPPTVVQVNRLIDQFNIGRFRSLFMFIVTTIVIFIIALLSSQSVINITNGELVLSSLIDDSYCSSLSSPSYSSNCINTIMSTSSSTSSSSASVAATPRATMPTLFLTHGGGPSFFMSVPPSHPMYAISSTSSNAAWLRNFAATYDLDGVNTPKAIVVVSAHWVTRGQKVRVTSAKQHNKGLNYDYGGFPEHMYKLQYSPPGNESLSDHIVSLLTRANIDAEVDRQWKFDHGVFIPLLMMFPAATIPVIEISIDASWDPSFHLRVGQSLSSLKHEGVLVIGSGSSTHNFQPDRTSNAKFMSALTSIVEDASITDADRQSRSALKWTSIPYARHAHPVEDHFVPYFVVAGASEGKRGKMVGAVEPAGTWCMASYLFE